MEKKVSLLIEFSVRFLPIIQLKAILFFPENPIYKVHSYVSLYNLNIFTKFCSN